MDLRVGPLTFARPSPWRRRCASCDERYGRPLERLFGSAGDATERARSDDVRLAVDEDAPALCAYAEDSDWAYVSAATPDGVAARILVEPEGAEDYEEGQDALSLTAQQTADPFEAMAVWSSFAPRPASADALRAIGTGQYVLREEAVMAFFTAMGIDVPWDRL